MTPRGPVPRIARLLDLLGALLFLAGAAAYAWAYFGLRELERFRGSAADPPWAAMTRFDELWRISRTGAWLMLAGGAVFIAGSAWAWWRRRVRA